MLNINYEEVAFLTFPTFHTFKPTSDEVHQEIEEMLESYRELISEISETDLVTHYIEITDDAPIN